MKKLVALLLGSAMVTTAIAGLAACGPKGGGGGEATRRPDPFPQDSYEAYDYTGAKVGAYRSIAAAINATVEADKDFTEDDEQTPGTKGGYVIKKGGTKHLFDNLNGFGGNNSDCFWYYEDGNKLTAFNCWDKVQGISILQNAKVVGHQTTSMGQESMQSWNGFGLLDAHAQLIGNEKVAPPTWEFSKPMDAGIMGFPARKRGVSGLRYSIDLSNVKITPAYEGITDGVYAYFGTYTWQDFYVLATGIACDTTTGDWYPFRGTSRDDSFYDIEYNVDGKSKPLFTSTWHDDENGGYFTPNVKTADLEIKTYRGIDEDESVYWEDRLSIVFDKGTKQESKYDLLIDDAMMNNYFSRPISADNGYVFIAGLDIKNHDKTVTTVPNVDYFNGAKFENFTVTAAAVYFPTLEEINDAEYALAVIDPDLRGRWCDALMANDEVVENTWDYTYLYNYSCTSYESKDGTDVYNFKFDGNPVSETEVGGTLKEYQDKVDSLSAMTVENASDYLATYDEVTKWYGADKDHTGSTGILQQYLLVLDFAPYEAAKPTYEASFKLTEQGQAILEELRTYSLLSAYDYKGWEAPAGTDVKGYLWSEAQKFGALLQKYNALESADKSNILRLYEGGKEEFESWKKTYEGIKSYMDNAAFTGKNYTIGNIAMSGTVTYTGAQALEKLFELAIKIHTTTYDGVPKEEAGTLCSDATGCYQDGFHLLFLLQKMKEEQVTVPAIFDEMFLSAITSTERSMGFLTDFNDYIYPVLTIAGEIYKAQEAGEFVWLNQELADRINACMVGKDGFDEGGFQWNCVTKPNPHGDLRNGDTNYEIYFGLPNENNNFRANLQYIIEVVSSADATAELLKSGLAYKANVKPLAEDPRENVSAAVKAVREAFASFSSMPKYEYKGWSTTGDDISGYLYNEVQAFKTKVKPLYDNLSEGDKSDFEIIANMHSFNEWMKLAEDDTILATYPALANITVNTYANPKNTTEKKDFSGMELFEHIVRWAYKLRIGGDFGEYNDYRKGNGILDFNGAPFPSSYLCSCYELLMSKAAADYELPGFLQDLFEEIEFETFYQTAWYPIVETARLAQRIHDENPEVLADLTDDDLTFLNKVWVSTYTIGELLDWNWNKGNKFEMYLSDAMVYMTILGGCTLTKTVTPAQAGDPTEVPLKAREYFEIVSNFLKKCGYTINSNGWGVTDITIEIPAVEAPIVTAAEINENFQKLSDVTDMTKYNIIGWETRGSKKQGFLYSEVQLFNRILKAYNDLTDKSGVTVATGAKWEAWEALATEINALVATKDFESTTISVLGRRWNDGLVTLTAAEAIVEIYTGAQLIAAGTKWGGEWDNDDPNNNGVTTLTSDNNWQPGVRTYFLAVTMRELGFKLPGFVDDLLESIEGGEHIYDDLDYIFAVLKIAKMLEDDANLKLTADLAELVNKTMVGKERFGEGGLNWNYQKDTGSFGGRSDKFITCFGLSLDGGKNFKTYLDSVIAWLVTNGATANEAGMGITANVTAK